MRQTYTYSLILGIILSAICPFAQAQSVGDTIVVSTFDYNSTTRDTSIVFPDFTGLTFEKVLMTYNMRCHDAEVNTTGGNGIACGEWDYSCNTYLHDDARADSINALANSHVIGGFSGTSFPYVTTPTYTGYQSWQTVVEISDVITETLIPVGEGDYSLPNVLDASSPNFKSQFLYTADELTDAGATMGGIDGMFLQILSGSDELEFLRVRMQATSETELYPTNPTMTGWIEVYEANTLITGGTVPLQFNVPFIWNGASNILVELSYANPNLGNPIYVEGSDSGSNNSIFSGRDFHQVFNGSNYVEAEDYKGIGGNADRTVEAWINTSIPNKEIVSWGLNATGQKWVFRVNDGGQLRVEVNGGSIYGTTLLDDGEWHHVACVFSGTEVDDILLYVDGQLETVGASTNLAINTNVVDGINLRVSRGVNDRYFEGSIDEVRIWDAALSESTLQDWMYRQLDDEHPNFDFLTLNYRFDEGMGISVADNGPYDFAAQAVNGGIWGTVKGIDIFKSFAPETFRPLTTFRQGEYEQTTIDVLVTEEVYNIPNPVSTYGVVSNAGTTMDDELVVTDYQELWEATENVIIDPSGDIIETIPVEPEGTIEITQIPYQRRWPTKLEIMSFVTPYGIGLDMGLTGETWTFDLTDFTPVLNGTKRFTVERGGQWQEELDVKFLFIVGTPPMDVIDIQQIWKVDQRNYGSISDDTYFTPRDVMTNATGTHFKIRSAITGHGQEGEFIPRTHNVNINGGANDFSWQVWKECAQNPLYPQGGTWVYDRAGWCPGMATDVVESDITAMVTPGESVNIDYGITSATGDSRYIVNHQLVTYGDANFELDASLLEVRKPSSRFEFDRFGTICHSPEVVIQNRGSETLTSLTINYWVNDATTPETYNWTGSLELMESEIVELPTPATLWDAMTETGNVFHASVESPNGGSDAYAYNDTYHESFSVPDAVPNEFLIMFKTNLQPHENSFELRDGEGNLIFERDNMTANTLYKDTLALGQGCYHFKVFDTDDDGIAFWATPNDGNGFVRFKEVGGPTFNFFENDYGDGINYEFTVDYGLSYEEVKDIHHFEAYPNPTKDQLNIALSGFDTEVVVRVYNGLGQLVISQNINAAMNKTTSQIDMHDLESGVYVVQATDGTRTSTQKVVKE